MAPVTLYGMPMSTCTRRVRTVLEEKGVPYELVVVDLSKGEHKLPDFLAKQVSMCSCLVANCSPLGIMVSLCRACTDSSGAQLPAVL